MKFRYRLPFALFMLALFVFFAIFPLFWPKNFGVDWLNHVWLLEYYTDYLVSYGRFPQTINVEEAFGNTMPLFYGLFFYPVLSLISVATGSDIAMRLYLIAIVIAPVASFYFIFRKIVFNKVISIYLSMCVNFSVYQLTNIYSRSALTEVSAYQCFLLGFSLLYYGFLDFNKPNMSIKLAGSAFIGFALGTHPITAYTIFLFLSPVLFYYFYKNSHIFSLSNALFVLGFLGFSALILTPWIVLTLKSNASLHMFRENDGGGKFFYFPDSIDSLWGKFGLFYIDRRVLEDGIFATSTPFLDAPLAWGLFLLLVLMIYNHRNHFKVIKIFMPFLVTSFLILYFVNTPEKTTQGIYPGSVSINFDNNIFYPLLKPIQFAYRISGVFSLCAMICFVSLAHILKEYGFRPLSDKKTLKIIYILACVSVIGNVQKFANIYIQYIVSPEYLINKKDQIYDDYIDVRNLILDFDEYKILVKNTKNYPFTFYGSRGFTMIDGYSNFNRKYYEDRQFVYADLNNYDSDIRFVCDKPCILVTNIMPSRLHRIVIDGLDASHALLDEHENLVFVLDSGTHSIRAEISNPLANDISLSIWVFVCLFYACLLACLVSLVRSGIIRWQGFDRTAYGR